MSINVIFYQSGVSVFQFYHVSLPLRGTYSTTASHSHYLLIQLLLSNMDSSSCPRIPAPSATNNNNQQLPEPGTPLTTTPVGEIDGRVDQLALVRSTLQNGATPTLVAGIAMLMAQMQAQVDHPDLVFTVSSGIGSLVRSSQFQDGVWHRDDLNHSIGNPRSHSIDGDPTRPPMDQERFLRTQPSTIRPLLASQSASAIQGVLPTRT